MCAVSEGLSLLPFLHDNSADICIRHNRIRRHDVPMAHDRSRTMGYSRILAGIAIGALALASSSEPIRAQATQQDEKLGRLSFPTSCDPKVQTEFERGVAMIHSYWFLVARRVFEGVLQHDPGCAIAYWGIALDLLGNSLGGPPSRENADAAWAALEKAREIGAKTDRERGWIDAVRAYYRDHDKTDVETRLRAYNSAMEQMAQRYPGDYEGQDFYALTLEASG